MEDPKFSRARGNTSFRLKFLKFVGHLSEGKMMNATQIWNLKNTIFESAIIIRYTEDTKIFTEKSNTIQNVQTKSRDQFSSNFLNLESTFLIKGKITT